MENEIIENSICIATYNGALYIKEQISSILSQIDEFSEIIVVDDCSIDDTISIIKSFNDKRIYIYKNESNLGVNKSFEKAISLSRGEYIFLSDQDDVWVAHRFILMKNLLNYHMCVSGNSTAIDKSGYEIDFKLGKLYEKESNAYFKNIIKIFCGKAFYYGCTMAFKQELINVVIPFPCDIESHDLYIAMAANLMHSNYHLEEIVLKRRIHGNNASVVCRSIIKKIKSRFLFFKHIMLLKKRIKNIYRIEKGE